ncbi:MAG: hypothetical protein KAI41_08795 [Hyphomicrobiaceae bacterium]|nr:hypothetical protein [Hyphomicrobiaceae bacterium]MCK5495392.1 hypothetical protein [Hyphomicrobiaceae bacterium]MCK5550615.1 hypothetical protein [Hyphomicrobiaceae bacterium]
MTIRNEDFKVAGRILFRHVEPKYGRPYLHTCSEAVFKEVLRVIDEAGGRSFTGEDLVGWTDAPHTQVFTALAFLKERGCTMTAHGRKNVAPTIFDVALDGMTEFEAAAHTGEWI